MAPRGTPLGPSGGRVFWATLGRACSRGRPRERRPRSKSRRFAAFRISRHLSHIAASFVVERPEVSIVKSRFYYFSRASAPVGGAEVPSFDRNRGPERGVRRDVDVRCPRGVGLGLFPVEAAEGVAA